MNKARESARDYCAATLRSLAQATMMYVAENRGSFPPAFLGWNTASVTSSNYQSSAIRPFIWDYLEKYGIKDNKARSCTEVSSDVPDINYKFVSGPATELNQVFTYKYNAIIGGVNRQRRRGQPRDGTNSYTTPLKAGKIPRSSRTVLFADSGLIDLYQTISGDPTNPNSWNVGRQGQALSQAGITDVWFRGEWPGTGGSNGVPSGPGLSGTVISATDAAHMQAFVDTHAVQHYKRVITMTATTGAAGWNDIPQKGMNNVVLADGSVKTVPVFLIDTAVYPGATSSTS